MKPVPFDYLAPTSIQEACKLLADAHGGATLLAGGQTLMPLLNLRMSQPFILVDVNHIAELQGISKQADGIRIGAATPQCEVLNSPLLAQELPALVEAVKHVGHHQTRNRGTVGGSIALGEPAAELPASAVAFDAVIDVHSSKGNRQIAAKDFYLGPYMNALQEGELVSAIIFPTLSQGHRPIFAEITQRPGDFALCGLVGALTLSSDNIIQQASLAWLAMGPTPLRASAAEELLTGKTISDLDAAAIASIADTAIDATAPFDDQRTSAEYRRTVGKKLLIKTLQQALATNSKEASA